MTFLKEIKCIRKQLFCIFFSCLYFMKIEEKKKCDQQVFLFFFLEKIKNNLTGPK